MWMWESSKISPFLEKSCISFLVFQFARPWWLAVRTVSWVSFHPNITRPGAVPRLLWYNTLLVPTPPPTLPWLFLVSLLKAQLPLPVSAHWYRVQSNSYDGPLKARKQHHIHSKDSLQAENHELFHLLFIGHDTYTLEAWLPSLGWGVQVCRCCSQHGVDSRNGIRQSRPSLLSPLLYSLHSY